MRRITCYLVSACCLGMLTGCGGSEDGGSETAEAQTQAASDTRGPDEVVFAFLEAVRVGDEAQANQLLTPMALKITAAHDLVVSPPGSPTARFEIGDVQFVESGDGTSPSVKGAHVASLWTDVDPSGQAVSDEIVWVLSQESSGWRIMGMAAQLEPNADPVFMNFEDETHVAFMAGEEPATTGPSQQPVGGQPAAGQAQQATHQTMQGTDPSGLTGQQPVYQQPVQQAQQSDDRYAPGVQ